jgi:hypothetical protein
LSDWERFAADAYLDHRHRNWLISEEMGDVRFQPEAGVVLVHRVRAEHIVRELGTAARAVQILTVPALSVHTPAAVVPAARVRAVQARAARTLRVTTLPASPGALARRSADSAAPRAVTAHARRRFLGGGFGLVLGATLFVVALAIRLDDAALLLALALLLRGGRLILEDGPAPP